MRTNKTIINCTCNKIKNIIEEEDKNYFLPLTVPKSARKKKNKRKGGGGGVKKEKESLQIFDDITWRRSRCNMRGWPLTRMILHRKPRRGGNKVRRGGREGRGRGGGEEKGRKKKEGGRKKKDSRAHAEGKSRWARAVVFLRQRHIAPSYVIHY